MVLGLKSIQKLNHKKMKPSDFLSIETETSFDSIQNSDEILISIPTQTIGVNRTSEESPGMDTMDTINNNETRKTQDRDRTAGLDLQSKKDDIDSIEVIEETLIFVCQIVLWKKVIQKTLIFAGQNVLWKKVIKKTLIFACQMVLWKKVIEKNFDFCLS